MSKSSRMTRGAMWFWVWPPESVNTELPVSCSPRTLWPTLLTRRWRQITLLCSLSDCLVWNLALGHWCWRNKRLCPEIEPKPHVNMPNHAAWQNGVFVLSENKTFICWVTVRWGCSPRKRSRAEPRPTLQKTHFTQMSLCHMTACHSLSFCNGAVCSCSTVSGRLCLFWGTDLEIPLLLICCCY